MSVKDLIVVRYSTEAAGVLRVKASWTYLGRSCLSLHDLPVVNLPIGDNTQCGIVDPCPIWDIIIHQVRSDLLLCTEVEQLELSTG